MNLSTTKQLPILAIVAVLATSCKKDLSKSDRVAKPTLNEALVYQLPATTVEITLVENVAKITGLIKILYLDKSNLSEVNAAILSKTYTDDCVALKDLIYPENSLLSKNKKFKELNEKWNITFGHFRNNFWRQVNKLNDQGFKNYLNT